jgi:hypothetical protein
MYQGALKVIRRILDCILCRIFVLDGLAQPQSCTPQVHMGLRMTLYRSNLFSVDNCDLRPMNQYIFHILWFMWFFSAIMWGLHVNERSRPNLVTRNFYTPEVRFNDKCLQPPDSVQAKKWLPYLQEPFV